MVNCNLKMHNPELVNLKCVTYAQPIPLSLIVHDTFVLMTNRHMNAKISYLHFRIFAETVLCPNFVLYS